jgi:hypothetical protein
MGAVDHHIATRRTCRPDEDDASFKAPCKDVDEAGDRPSGANKAQTMSEAAEANGVV